MPKELTTEVVKGCLYTCILIVRSVGHTPPEITLITLCVAKPASPTEFHLLYYHYKRIWHELCCAVTMHSSKNSWVLGI